MLSGCMQVRDPGQAQQAPQQERGISQEERDYWSNAQNRENMGSMICDAKEIERRQGMKRRR